MTRQYTSVNNPDLVRISNEVDKIETQLRADKASDIKGSLRHLLLIAHRHNLGELNRRIISCVSEVYESRKPSLKSYFSLKGRIKNLIDFGKFKRTPNIARSMRHKLSDGEPASSIANNKSDDADTNTNPPITDVFYDAREVERLDSEIYHECASVPDQDFQTIEAPKNIDINTQLPELLSALQNAYPDLPIATSHVSEALTSILFPFIAQGAEAPDQRDQCTLTFQANEPGPSFSIELQGPNAFVGEVATNSRVPFDFYIAPKLSLEICTRAETTHLAKGISINFGKNDFRLLRLTPEKSLAICNSFKWAAKVAGAVTDSVAGLNLAMSVKVEALDFTEAGEVMMREKDLTPYGWNANDVADAQAAALDFFVKLVPKNMLALRFARSAWTMGCIRQKPEEYSGAQYPKAKSDNFLAIIRDKSIERNSDPGRISWRAIGNATLGEHMLAIDKQWSPRGIKGEINLVQKGGQALIQRSDH